MHLSIPAGTTSKDIPIPVYDSSSTTGAKLAGLVYNSGSLTAYYSRQGAAGAATAISLATKTKGTWVTSGFVAIDGTNMPGDYELGIPDAALAAGATWVMVQLKGAANMVPVTIVIQLTSVTDYPANMTQVAGSTVSTSTAQLGVNAVNVGGTAQTGRDIGASVLLSAGTGTGQLDFTSGVVKANLVQILATALTETAGQIAAAFKQFFNIASPTSTMNTVTAVTTATNLTNAATAGDLTATMKTSVTTACTASTPTAAAVTGAVGSVTGNVGGSVASVTGAVGSVTGAVGSISSGGINRAAFATDTGLQVVRANTAVLGAATTITLDNGASATDSFYNGCLVYLTGGTGVGQARIVTGYVGATKIATVDHAWITNPDVTSTFALWVGSPLV